ncbi:hypothetical protein [Halalkalicoccus jeotgali]|uniref:Uncharacterized protein n=1 Tax=Halalkalicoccus jeotgali (strain DSM 18796 / CECT 7217 / JCM 14584 / KCTC 4019 / B3) TaxID=795797 RepID=D8J2B7_HALJB|nr:hypothetical protein [Halalkalicoccus jeotgali]ADJ14874.1 hypothetical protein HacjB3_07445 [Halalkalicoccus jeotgali B3]ELY39456.1 hypothetical protein C497_05852 [Halalkalicoccus jeotgali B3]
MQDTKGGPSTGRHRRGRGRPRSTTTKRSRTETKSAYSTSTIPCPRCGDEVVVPSPTPGTDLLIRRSVALAGEHIVAACDNDHRFWVYYC